MAGSSKYRIDLETKLDVEKGLADAQARARNKTITVNLKFDENDILKRFEQIRKGVDSLASMTARKDSSGAISQYTLNYADQYKNKYSEIWRLTEQIDATTGKTVSKWVSTSKVVDGVAARQKEINAALQKANEFLEKSSNMSKTPAVNAAIAKAQEIKVAVSEGDVAKVQRLNSELKVMEAGLSGTRVGLQNWTESLGRAIKQTVSYSLSIGLVYGALGQLRQGLQYIVDLNKEMTNIQIVTGDTDENIQKLSEGYNQLAKDMSVSTLEIAKGERKIKRPFKISLTAGISLELNILNNICEYIMANSNVFGIVKNVKIGQSATKILFTQNKAQRPFRKEVPFIV